MTNKLQPLRGMRDLFGDDYKIHSHIVDTAQRISSLYCYDGASVPILEYTKVFDRTLGDTSDVVSKEMYSFLDKSGDGVALRPEFTASIMRAIISGGMAQKLPLKLFSHGPVFRYDRPQAGRQRQFHQINCEYIGSSNPYSDSELIKLAAHILDELGMLNDTTLEINSLGCHDSRFAYQEALSNYFEKHKSELSEDSLSRLAKKNPIRILDSKSEQDKKISANAPFVYDYYTKESREYFDQVLKYLDILNVKYKINPRLARGLDYYCHTAFEFTTDKLGSQGTVLAGGRYDYLSKLMGGPDIPGLGFAGGIERMALMMDSYKPTAIVAVYVLPIGDDAQNYAIQLANYLRSNGVVVGLELYGKIQKRMEKALKDNATYIVFTGTDEVKNNNFKLKILATKEERSVSLDELLKITRSF